MGCLCDGGILIEAEHLGMSIGSGEFGIHVGWVIFMSYHSVT